ncbi:AEC family transporter [Curvivirga aplysinae]|uniref:AEC family transporter n=1 Tax=Curvivirga aplysinae TaxID=2529852 RepID=UPI0012BBC118|nr:AEC family transporter [Curvivirga aplysinae]MTI10311.1 AEC family transporter [Curvivirga aplysinae]
MFSITLTIAPVFLLLMVGFGLRKSGFIGPEVWAGLDKIVYWVLFPALLFTKTSIAPLGGDIFWPYLTSLEAGIFLSGVFIWLMIPLFKKKYSKESMGSIYQGAIRYNTYIGFAILVAIEGPEAQFLGALATAVMVPFVNVLCVSTLTTLHGDPETHLFKRIIKELYRNPLLRAIAAGVAWNLTGLGPIPVITDTLESMSSATLAMGLLSVGAGLQLRALRTASLPIILSCIGKFFILPAVTALGLYLWGITGLPAFTAFLFACLPTAASGYALAKQLGGDVPLIAGLITIHTLVSMALMPFVILLAQYLYL